MNIPGVTSDIKNYGSWFVLKNKVKNYSKFLSVNSNLLAYLFFLNLLLLIIKLGKMRK